MKTVNYLLVITFLCISYSITAQKELSFDDFTKLETEEPKDLSKLPDHLLLEMKYGSASIPDGQSSIPSLNQKIYKIEYYYSDYPKGKNFDPLHEKRIRQLVSSLPQVLTDKEDIRWVVYKQTDCNTLKEAADMFHGFIIYTLSSDNENGLSQAYQDILDAVDINVELEAPKSEQDITQFLQGAGVLITNLKIKEFFNGMKPYKYFTEEKGVIGLSKGLLMTTGLAENAIGPNDSKSETAVISREIIIDPDLASLYDSDRKLYDPCIIEFDVQADADTLVFNYVFASEEYPEYLDYHDVFGFFISGKGIDGAKRLKLTPEALDSLKKENLPELVFEELAKIAQKPSVDKNGFKKYLKLKLGDEFFNTYYSTIEKYVVDTKNIAIVPGTDQVVSVETINPYVNENYYVENNIFTNKELFSAWQYDGFSKVMQAKVKIIPKEIYHLKLAIADQGDPRYDSAIFIEGKGFKSKGEIIDNSPKMKNESKF